MANSIIAGRNTHPLRAHRDRGAGLSIIPKGFVCRQIQAQLRHVNGRPLSVWITSATDLRGATEAVLQIYRREDIRVAIEAAL